MLNGLILLYALLFQNAALAIIALTVVTRVIFYPLTLKQLRSSARMQSLQPQLEALRAKYKNNPSALNREMMAMYKQAGVSPLGCLGPMVLQFPIWIGLYYAIIKGLGTLPGSFVYLSQRLYSWLPVGGEQLPLDTGFLWMDLTSASSTGGPLDAILPLLVAASTWAQQKVMQPPAMSAQQQQQQKIMGFMFPIMLGFFAFTFPSGLALYWFVSNLITVGLQGFVSGWGNLRLGRTPATVPPPSSAVIEARNTDGKEPGGDGENRRRGDSDRSRGTRSKPRRRRRRRT